MIKYLVMEFISLIMEKKLMDMINVLMKIGILRLIIYI